MKGQPRSLSTDASIANTSKISIDVLIISKERKTFERSKLRVNDNDELVARKESKSHLDGLLSQPLITEDQSLRMNLEPYMILVTLNQLPTTTYMSK